MDKENGKHNNYIPPNCPPKKKCTKKIMYKIVKLNFHIFGRNNKKKSQLLNFVAFN